MEDVITQAQVEAELMRLTNELEVETDRLLTLGRDFATKDSNYRRDRAMAYLKHGAPNEKGKTPPVAEREAQAEVDTADANLARRIAEVTYEASREKCRTIRTALDALRAINANVRANV